MPAAVSPRKPIHSLWREKVHRDPFGHPGGDDPAEVPDSDQIDT